MEPIAIDSILTHLKCPLSTQLFRYPVIADDTVVYEAIEIYNYMKKHDNKSPKTGKCIKELVFVSPVKEFVDAIVACNRNLSRYPEYTIPKVHILHINEINSIFTSKKKKYEQILAYTEFDLRLIWNSLTALIAEAKKNKDVVQYIKYILDNCMNINVLIQSYDATNIVSYICWNGTPELIDLVIDHKDAKFTGTDMDMHPMVPLAKKASAETLLKLANKISFTDKISDGISVLDYILIYRDSATIISILNSISIASNTVKTFEKSLKSNMNLTPDQYEEIAAIIFMKGLGKS
jgi:hypothetical protein